MLDVEDDATEDWEPRLKDCSAEYLRGIRRWGEIGRERYLIDALIQEAE